MCNNTPRTGGRFAEEQRNLLTVEVKVEPPKRSNPEVVSDGIPALARSSKGGLGLLAGW